MEKLKKASLRYSEYYQTQELYDNLYKASKNGNNFYKLYDLIISDNNILRAYRSIKNNKGSMTKGTNNRTIEYIANMTEEEVIKLVRDKLTDYKPQKVRRVMIPKPNGKLRPLGIPNIEDRLIQQCILQVLKPICEAKFHPHSYGFRDNRSAHHAMARVGHMINRGQIAYVVDIDIKGFFDNVNHNKLLKQMWSLGIRDKKVLSIINKILKSEIEGEGIPTKGTPQGGIISPLLSNIVLNELDWWVSSQWETHPTKYEYSTQSKKYRALKNTNLKEVWLVRYADDFKLLCRNYQTAQKMYHATTKWLKDRLDLDYSPEKTKIVNLKHNYSEFLGFKIKAVYKKGKLVWRTKLCDKAKDKIFRDIKSQQIKIQRAKKDIGKQVGRYNSMILGYQNYYKIATHVNRDFTTLEHRNIKALKNRLRDVKTKKKYTKKQIRKGTIAKQEIFATSTYNKFYGEYNYKPRVVAKRLIYPLGAVKTKPPMNFNQNICDYTVEGRKLIHDNLKADMSVIEYLIKNPNPKESIEYNDNRISVYLAQYGRCKITKKFLRVDEINIHHKKLRSQGGSDKYNNLVMLHKDVHKLIHATKEATIKDLLAKLKINADELKQINLFRSQAENLVINSI